MGQINYSKTLSKLHAWTYEISNRISGLQTQYTVIGLAVSTGEGDPNSLILTPAQVVVLENDLVAIEQQVVAICSAHDVEPIEIPD